MIIICGASASGKTEVAKILCSKYGFNKFVTTTTRQIRPGEQNGIDYNFVTLENFAQKIKNNSFIEYVNYNNNFYGTEKRLINDQTVLIIEPNGLNEFIKLNNSHIITFFLECDEAIRKERMILRKDKIEDINNRLKNDKEKFNIQNINKIDFIINTSIDSPESIATKINEFYLQKLKNI